MIPYRLGTARAVGLKTLSLGALYMPLWFFVAYMLFTLTTALFGPIDYIDFPKLKVGSFIVFVLVCCAAGYHFGVRSSQKLTNLPKILRPADSRGRPKAMDVVLAISLAGVIAFISSSIVTGELNLNIFSLGETYNSSYDGYQRNTGNYSTSFIVFSLLSAPVFIASVWGIYFFRYLNLSRRIVVLSIILGTLLVFTLGSGKMKQLGDVIIYLIAIAAISRAASGKGFEPKFITRLSILALIALCLFAFIVAQRYAEMGTDAFNINQKTAWQVQYNTEHPVFRVLGSNIGFAVSVVSFYLSNGYYGLGLTLESAPTWSFFTGTSYSVSVIADRFLGLPSGYAVSYPYLTGVETGWGESKWYTVFPWFASDFSFIGTGLLFGLFAFWYARAWLESVILRDPFAVLLFTLMTVGVFYAPANNQVMHTPGGLATLFVVVGLYLAAAARRRWLVRRLHFAGSQQARSA